MKLRHLILTLAFVPFLSGCEAEKEVAEIAAPLQCGGSADTYQLFWGDLHVHSALSMDAYAFGTRSSPADAFKFARGQKSGILPDGTEVKQSRPLDFAAVTDHAETFDVMHICTTPGHEASNSYCEKFRELSGNNPANSILAFRNFLLPVIAGARPKKPVLCEEQGVNCEIAAAEAWQAVQEAANQANAPCDFTAFVGFEWSATPNNSHWHRNVIFKDENVTAEAIDYVRFPSPDALWSELDRQCKSEDGCNVLAIPHNTNLSEGGGFDVEKSGEAELFRRAKYERLIELVQSKGTSECLPENWDDPVSDCGFETFLLQTTRQKMKDNPAFLDAFNRSFTRNILSRGLLAYKQSGDQKLNPLQLGIIGSTDNHTATPGLVGETEWKGGAWGGGDSSKKRWLQRVDYNPGGLVAVWALENTRSHIFDAMMRRHVYATSGTRIKLRFAAASAAQSLCTGNFMAGTPMGGTLAEQAEAPIFSIQAEKDVAPLMRIEVVKGQINKGVIEERVVTVEENSNGIDQTCVTWSDPDFNSEEPAYWYARISEIPTPRWSKYACESLGTCADVPKADRLISERAWSSPIWYLP